jgi:hypothetical protein
MVIFHSFLYVYQRVNLHIFLGEIALFLGEISMKRLEELAWRRKVFYGTSPLAWQPFRRGITI